MDLGLDGRVALVTGGSKGIGRGIAAALAAEGAQVAIASRVGRADRGRRGRDRRAAATSSTPTTSTRCPALLERVEGDLGPIDIYIANTGGPPGGPDPLALHARAVGGGAPHARALADGVPRAPAARRCATRGWGRVVAIGSIAVREPIDALQLSNAHRPGLVAAFKVLARRYAADGVTLNYVHPGRIATDRMIGTAGSLEAAQAAAREHGPGGPARHRRGARRRRGLPLLAAARPTSPARACWSTAGSRAASAEYPQGESNPRYRRERLAC